MPNLQTLFWLLIRKESTPERIDWGAVFTLMVYGFLVLLLVGGFLASVWSWHFYGLPPQG